MKKYFHIFFICYSYCLIAQTHVEKLQEETFKFADSLLKKNNFNDAYSSYNKVCTYNRNNNICKKAVKKIDSIKPILREKLLNKIIGLWKLKSIADKEVLENRNPKEKSKMDSLQKGLPKFYKQKMCGSIEDSTYQYLIITKDKLYFYNHKTDKFTIEKIVYNDDIEKHSNNYYFLLKFSDGLVWYFIIDDYDKSLVISGENGFYIDPVSRESITAKNSGISTTFVKVE